MFAVTISPMGDLEDAEVVYVQDNGDVTDLKLGLQERGRDDFGRQWAVAHVARVYPEQVGSILHRWDRTHKADEA